MRCRCLAAFLFALSVAVPAANALIGIDPASEDLSLFSEKKYVFYVNISGLSGVYGFQFDLRYDPLAFSIANGSEVWEGGFLSRNGQDSVYCVSPDVSVPGLIDGFACTRTGPGSVSGSGILAGVRLIPNASVMTPAAGQITLSDVKVSDINAQPLDNSAENGSAAVYECLAGETRACTGGTRTCESGNVWGSCVPSTQPPGGGGGGPPPPGNGNGNGLDETDGDINGDGCVDMQDLMLIRDNFGLSSGFDPRADVNDGGEVNIFDLAAVSLLFGTGSGC